MKDNTEAAGQPDLLQLCRDMQLEVVQLKYVDNTVFVCVHCVLKIFVCQSMYVYTK